MSRPIKTVQIFRLSIHTGHWTSISARIWTPHRDETVNYCRLLYICIGSTEHRLRCIINLPNIVCNLQICEFTCSVHCLVSVAQPYTYRRSIAVHAKMRLNTTEYNCGGTLVATEQEQEFTSPNYPLPYECNMKCRWTIPRPQGMTVRLEFVAVDLERHKDCEYDFVKVGQYGTFGILASDSEGIFVISSLYKQLKSSTTGQMIMKVCSNSS